MKNMLEIKRNDEIVHCRMYRQLIEMVCTDRDLHGIGNSYLTIYLLLYSHASKQISYRQVGDHSFKLHPGEWILKTSEFASWLNSRSLVYMKKALNYLQTHHYISFSYMNGGRYIKYKLVDWEKHNPTNPGALCQYDKGFFYFPLSAAEELITIKHSSDADILLDLWIRSCVSCLPDSFIQFEMSTSPILRRSVLAKRWGRSVHSVCKAIKKLSEKGYICYQSLNEGIMIRLNGYLHTMYQLSIDPLSLNAQPCPVQIPFHNYQGDRPQMNEIVRQTLHFLSLQIPCSSCSRSSFYVIQKDLPQIKDSYGLSIHCGGQEKYSYSIAVKTTGKEC